MVAPGGLVLSPAQRLLVEKSLAARRAKEETAAIQRAVDSAARRHVEETKARCRATHRKDDQSMIIRHVGEQLANVAKREHLLDPHKRAGVGAAKSANASGATAARRAAGSDSAQRHSASASASGESGNDDDGYDEDRFGPVRRPPRVRPPNLWVSVRLVTSSRLLVCAIIQHVHSCVRVSGADL